MTIHLKIKCLPACLLGFTLLLTAMFSFVRPVLASDYEWKALEDGVESRSFILPSLPSAGNPDSRPITLAVLRLDPQKVDFELLMASEQGQAKTITDWAKGHNLIAAINASMYLPDKVTSTGYMRSNEHINNNRIGSSFGAFFVAGPDNKKFADAAVLDRKLDEWEDKLAHYAIVIQNFRMIDADGLPLWGGTTELFSIAAVGQDSEDRILFFHVAQPMTVNNFVNKLMDLPLNIKRLMYVEGGHQAAMLVNAGEQNQVWTGNFSLFIQTNSLGLLPNVLGVKRKNIE